MAGTKREEILTLFDTDSENESFEDTEDSDLEESGFEGKHIPVNEAIAAVPNSYPEFLELLLPRLQPNLKITNVSIEDQQSFAKIVIGELASQYIIISHQIDDPFLTPVMNKELHRSIYVEVAYILETVFHTYLLKASRLNENGVLNMTAQLSCLRAELIIDINKRLNIPLIRRKAMTRIQNGSSSHHLSLSSKREQSSSHDYEMKKISQMQLKVPVVHLPVTDDYQQNEDKSQSPPYKESVTVSGYASRLSRVQSSSHLSSVHDEEDNIDKYPLTYDAKRAISYTALKTNTLFSEMGMKRERGDDIKKCRKEFLGLWETPSLDTIQDINAHMIGSHRDDPAQKIVPKLGEYTDEMLRNDIEHLAKGEVKVPSSLIKSDASEELSPLLAVYTSLKDPPKLIEQQVVSSTPQQQEETIINDTVMTPHLSKGPSWDDHDEKGSGQLLPHIIPQYSIDSRSLRNTDGLNSEMDGHSSRCSITSYSSGEGEEREEEIHSQLLSSLHSTSDSQQQQQLEEEDWEEREEERGEEKREEEKEEERGEEEREEANSLSHEEDRTHFNKSQPDVLSLQLEENNTARASEVRVSQRSPLFSLRLQPYPAFYNELTDDLDIISVEHLDSNLKEGQDIHEIYDELSQTFSQDHLNFDKDPVLEPSLDKKIKMSTLYASSSLHHRKTRRVINDFLIHSGLPPWRDKTRREWLAGRDKLSQSPSHYQKVWKNQDKDAISVDDYFRFIANKGSDYLGVVHHMYDSGGSDSEDEQKEIEKKRKQEKLRQELLAKEKHRLELLRQKNSFTSGEWNVNTVVMGGLGNDPEEITNQQQGASTSIDWSSVQARLSKIWKSLEMPHVEQVTMAIKFSNPQFAFYITKVLDIWENCCESIKIRESALHKLESFERHASDPARYFSKSISSLTRLREAKQRTSLHKTLDSYDRSILSLVKALSKHDFTLTYKGRNYVEKMRMDRVELLYFLHQQRRQTVLKPALQLLNLS